MNISIFASIGCQNLGDELILQNEIQFLRQEFGKKTNFTVFSYDTRNHFFVDDGVKYKEYFPIGSKNIKNFFKNMYNFFVFLRVVICSDMVVVGGGGIMYDTEHQSTKSPLDLWVFRTKILRFFRKKIYFFRVGIDVKKEESYKKLEQIFKNAYKVEVRDENSKEILARIGVASKIQLDPVFFDAGSPDVSQNMCIKKIPAKDFSFTDLQEINLSGKTVGIAFRSGYLVKTSNVSHRMEEGIMRELIHFIHQSGGKVTLLPHSFHKTDKKANDYDFLKKFVSEGVEIKKSMQEVYEVYRGEKIDFCLAMRLHSMILSQVYGIPYMGVSYSRKTDEIYSKLY